MSAKTIVSDNGAVVWKLEGGMSYKLILREADPDDDDVRHVLPDPTGKPIISARFRYFDRLGPHHLKLIAKKHVVFRPLEFSSHAKHHFYLSIGQGLYGLTSIVNQFFDAGDGVERIHGFDSTSDVGYFCLDVTREGWVGSPCFWAWQDPPCSLDPGHPYFKAVQDSLAAIRVEAARALREAEALRRSPMPEAVTVEEEAPQHSDLVVVHECPPQGSYMPLGPTRPDWIQKLRALYTCNWSLESQCFHDTDCAICLERLIEGDRVTVMPCKTQHRFHTDCIFSWLNTMNHCPMCRHCLPTTETI